MVVASSVVYNHWSLTKKFNATIINDIWPEVMFFTLVATAVALITNMVHPLVLQNGLLTVLGTVLGLVISFRTSSAYERFQEGRKLWANITLASRNLAQLLWIHVPVDRNPTSGTEDIEQRKAARLMAVIEKKTMINLVQAFAVSVKHFLRSEPGIYYEDLYPLISFLPRHAMHHTEPTATDSLPMWLDHDKLSQTARLSPTSTPSASLSSPHKRRKDYFDPEKALPQVSSDVPLRAARMPPQPTIYDYVPLLVFFRPLIAGPHRLYRCIFPKPEPTMFDTTMPASTRSLTGKIRAPPPVDSNVPLEITLFLNSYSQTLMQKKLLEPAIASSLALNLSSLQDAVTNLERVRNTPIPYAYQAHLRMSLWLYLLFLPSQLVASMNYFVIPATCFASFLLLGFLEIGREIENPFNYDENDLDMDSFCLAIQRELHEITAHPAPDPHTYIFAVDNQPFAPVDRRNAEEMVQDLDHHYHAPDHGMDHIRRTLLRNWKEVEVVTREP